jgi:hypothetical protein
VTGSLYIGSNKYNTNMKLISVRVVPHKEVRLERTILQFYNMAEILYFMDLNAGLQPDNKWTE